MNFKFIRYTYLFGTSSLYREYAYAPKGKSVYGEINGRKFKRVGIVVAQMGGKIISPLQYEGTMDSSLFEQWFEQKLLPNLPPKTVIVMDNETFHRKRRLFLLLKNLNANSSSYLQILRI